MKKALTILIVIILSFNAFAQVPNYVPTNSLVGWWSFTGNANDSSGNGNNGAVYGATLTTDRQGNPNSAYSFDGSTSFILISNTLIPDMPSSYSISMWFKIGLLVNSNGNSPTLISDRDTGLSSYKYTIDMRVLDSTIESVIYDGLPGNGQRIAAKKIKDTNWHHVVQVYDTASKNLTQYVDGNVTGVLDSISQWSNRSNPTYVGMWNGFVGYSGYFNGKIDDIGIWNRALNQQEILQLYNTTTGLNELNPNEEIKIYPNPAKDYIEVTCSNLGEMDGNSLKITNTFGQVVFNNVITQQTFDIDLSKLGGAGLYFLYVSDPNQTIKSVKKIVLQ